MSAGWVGESGALRRPLPLKSFRDPFVAARPKVVETVAWDHRPGRTSAFHVFADWRVWWTDDEGEDEGERRPLRDVERLLCGHAVTRRQLEESGELVALRPDKIPEWPLDRPGRKLCGVCRRLLVAEIMAGLPQPWVYRFARAFEESVGRARRRRADLYGPAAARGTGASTWAR